MITTDLYEKLSHNHPSVSFKLSHMVELNSQNYPIKAEDGRNQKQWCLYLVLKRDSQGFRGSCIKCTQY